MDINNFFFTRPLTLLIMCAVSYWLSPSLAHSTSKPNEDYEIIVHTGKVSEAIDLFKSRNFWGGGKA